MNKKLLALFSLLLIASMVLGACRTATETPAATTAATEKVVATEEEVEVKPTEEVEEPGGAAVTEAVTISFWEQEGEEVDVFIDQLIAEFQDANPLVTIERTHYENEALRDQFQTASLAAAAPEVVRVPNDFAGPFSTLQIVAPVNELFDATFLGQFFEGALGPAKVGGVLWGVPDNYGNHLMLLYNKDLVAEPPATFEELVTTALELTDGDIQGFAYNLNEPFWGAGFYGAFGGWPLDAADQPDFDNQAFVDYLTFVASLKTDGVVPAECDYACADTLFKEGKAAMIINGDWSLGDYTTALGDKLGTAPVPPIDGNPYTAMTAGKYFMVSSAVLDDPNRQAAVTQFISFMTSADVQKRWLDEYKRLPSNKEVAEDPSIASDPVLAGSMAALSVGRGMPAAATMRCAWDAWRPNLEGVMSGSTTPEEAGPAAQAAAEECVAGLGEIATEPPAAEEPTEEEIVLPTFDGPSEAVTLSFWEQEGEEVDVFIDQLIAEFQEKYPNVTVERTHYENEALRDQFQTASLASAAPEIVRVPNDFAGPFSELEIVAPVDSLFDEAFLSQFFEGALGPARVAGTLWGVPDNYGNHLMLLYNKDLVAEPPATFEELVTTALELTDGDIQGFAYNLNEPFWGAGFYGAFGGWPLDEADQPTFDNQAFIDYLTFVASLKTDGVVPAECDYACADTLFKEGKAAMIINGDWSLGDYTTALGDKLGTAPVPPINGNPFTAMTAGKYFMVSNAVLDDEQKLSATQAFIAFMTSADVQKRWLDEYKRLPSNKVVAEDPSIAADPVLAGSMAALSVGRGMPAAATMRCAWDAWRPNLEGAMAGTITPEEAAAAAQAAAEECVAGLGG